MDMQTSQWSLFLLVLTITVLQTYSVSSNIPEGKRLKIHASSVKILGAKNNDQKESAAFSKFNRCKYSKLTPS